jgi:small subunit ribosomal protein S2
LDDAVLISGRLGLLARTTGDGVEVMRVDGNVKRLPAHEVARLFGRAGDVIEMRDGDLSAALETLAAEHTCDLALRRLIMILDAEDDADIAERAATRLEGLLESTRGLEIHLENEFSSAPLPPDAAIERCRELALARPRLATLLSLIVGHQPAIARNRRAFDDAIIDAGLSTETAAPVLAAVTATGLFRRMLYGSRRQALSLLAAYATEAGWHSDAIVKWHDRLSEAWTEAADGRAAAPPVRAERAAGSATGGRSPGAAKRMFASLFGSTTPAAIASMPRAYASGVPPLAPTPPRPPDAELLRDGNGVPIVTLQQLLESGAHFGHQTHRWNPKMKPYIFGERNGAHIIDLSQTVPLFARALEFVSSTVASGGKVLFVGTKRQAQEPIADAARRSGQHFVNHRWLGGMLTQWKTISSSIKRLTTLEEQLSGDTHGLTKKEVLQLTRERDKLGFSLGGIRDMGGLPDVIFVIDANKEELAIKEANVLGIPVVAILDTNVSPKGIAFPVPGNDDASRAIRLYCEAIAIAATRGETVAHARHDVGELDRSPSVPGHKAQAEAEPDPEEAPSAEAPDGFGTAAGRDWSFWRGQD